MRCEHVLNPDSGPERKIRVVPVEVYSRVVGYFRPVNQWNKGKREEFNERVEYKIKSEVSK